MGLASAAQPLRAADAPCCAATAALLAVPDAFAPDRRPRCPLPRTNRRVSSTAVSTNSHSITMEDNNEPTPNDNPTCNHLPATSIPSQTFVATPGTTSSSSCTSTTNSARTTSDVAPKHDSLAHSKRISSNANRHATLHSNQKQQQQQQQQEPAQRSLLGLLLYSVLSRDSAEAAAAAAVVAASTSKANRNKNGSRTVHTPFDADDRPIVLRKRFLFLLAFVLSRTRPSRLALALSKGKSPAAAIAALASPLSILNELGPSSSVDLTTITSAAATTVFGGLQQAHNCCAIVQKPLVGDRNSPYSLVSAHLVSHLTSGKDVPSKLLDTAETIHAVCRVSVLCALGSYYIYQTFIKSSRPTPSSTSSSQPRDPFSTGSRSSLLSRRPKTAMQDRRVGRKTFLGHRAATNRRALGNLTDPQHQTSIPHCVSEGDLGAILAIESHRRATPNFAAPEADSNSTATTTAAATTAYTAATTTTTASTTTTATATTTTTTSFSIPSYDEANNNNADVPVHISKSPLSERFKGTNNAEASDSSAGDSPENKRRRTSQRHLSPGLLLEKQLVDVFTQRPETVSQMAVITSSDNDELDDYEYDGLALHRSASVPVTVDDVVDSDVLNLGMYREKYLRRTAGGNVKRSPSTAFFDVVRKLAYSVVQECNRLLATESTIAASTIPEESADDDCDTKSSILGRMPNRDRLPSLDLLVQWKRRLEAHGRKVAVGTDGINITMESSSAPDHAADITSSLPPTLPSPTSSNLSSLSKGGDDRGKCATVDKNHACVDDFKDHDSAANSESCRNGVSKDNGIPIYGETFEESLVNAAAASACAAFLSEQPGNGGKFNGTLEERIAVAAAAAATAAAAAAAAAATSNSTNGADNNDSKNRFCGIVPNRFFFQSGSEDDGASLHNGVSGSEQERVASVMNAALMNVGLNVRFDSNGELQHAQQQQHQQEEQQQQEQQQQQQQASQDRKQKKSDRHVPQQPNAKSPMFWVDDSDIEAGYDLIYGTQQKDLFRRQFASLVSSISSGGMLRGRSKLGAQKTLLGKTSNVGGAVPGNFSVDLSNGEAGKNYSVGDDPLGYTPSHDTSMVSNDYDQFGTDEDQYFDRGDGAFRRTESELLFMEIARGLLCTDDIDTRVIEDLVSHERDMLTQLRDGALHVSYSNAGVSSLADSQKNPQSITQEVDRQLGWDRGFSDKIVVVANNLLLWNASPDPDHPVIAFSEYTSEVLSRLFKIFAGSEMRRIVILVEILGVNERRSVIKLFNSKFQDLFYDYYETSGIDFLKENIIFYEREYLSNSMAPTRGAALRLPEEPTIPVQSSMKLKILSQIRPLYLIDATLVTTTLSSLAQKLGTKPVATWLGLSNAVEKDVSVDTINSGEIKPASSFSSSVDVDNDELLSAILTKNAETVDKENVVEDGPSERVASASLGKLPPPSLLIVDRSMLFAPALNRVEKKDESNDGESTGHKKVGADDDAPGLIDYCNSSHVTKSTRNGILINGGLKKQASDKKSPADCGDNVAEAGMDTSFSQRISILSPEQLFINYEMMRAMSRVVGRIVCVDKIAAVQSRTTTTAASLIQGSASSLNIGDYDEDDDEEEEEDDEDVDDEDAVDVTDEDLEDAYVDGIKRAEPVVHRVPTTKVKRDISDRNQRVNEDDEDEEEEETGLALLACDSMTLVEPPFNFDLDEDLQANGLELNQFLLNNIDELSSKSLQDLMKAYKQQVPNKKVSPEAAHEVPINNTFSRN